MNKKIQLLICLYLIFFLSFSCSILLIKSNKDACSLDMSEYVYPSCSYLMIIIFVMICYILQSN